ncbi:MAG TPA: flavin reductase family protein [Ktedonobacteraceae bacterium]|nr:flavin reductase family protein [Ktedonobacteraceae bacterium]
MTIEKSLFRQVMGQFATGITIVTAQHNDIVAGLTVNSFCSASLDPPLVLVCVDLNSNTLPFIRQSGAFAINILTNKQEHLSQCFATPSDERFERFCNTPYHLAVTGSPILDDVLAFLDTRIVAEYPGGDHVIFLAQVEALGTNGHVSFTQGDGQTPESSNLHTHQSNGTRTEEDTTPLLYYRGLYRQLAPIYHHPGLAKAPENAATTKTHGE